MTREQIKILFPQASEAFVRKNLGLPVGAVEGAKPEPALPPALERSNQKQERSESSLAIGITLVAFRRRLLDDDNNVGSTKPLRDAIAETLGIDDGDERLTWRYHQLKTDGEEGVVVTIEQL